MVNYNYLLISSHLVDDLGPDGGGGHETLKCTVLQTVAHEHAELSPDDTFLHVRAVSILHNCSHATVRCPSVLQERQLPTGEEADETLFGKGNAKRCLQQEVVRARQHRMLHLHG